MGPPALDTVCQPDAGYGYHEYSHNYYKEDAQGTCYNVPGLNFVESAVGVTYPEPIQTGGNEPISLPRISCEDLSEEKCITIPGTEVVSETFEKTLVESATSENRLSDHRKVGEAKF